MRRKTMRISTKVDTCGVINYVSNYRKRLFKSRYQNQNSPDSYQVAIKEMLWEYNDAKCTEDRKKELRLDILMHLFFLFLDYLKKNYHLKEDLFNDAFQNMNVNTLQAIDLFKPEFGVPFTSYLVGYFRNAVSKTLRSCYMMPKASLRQVVIEPSLPLDKENDHSPNIVPLADDERKGAGLTVADEKCLRSSDCSDEDFGHTFEDPLRCSRKTLQDLQIWVDSVGLDIERVCVMEQNDDVDERIHAAQLLNWLEHALSEKSGVLTADERFVVTYHYGLFGAKQMKYAEIARIRRLNGRGSACSRISQINTAALRKLRDFFNNRGVSL